MPTIGIVTIDSDENVTVTSVLEATGFQLITIQNKTQLTHISSLVILSENPSNFRSVCEWIASAQEQSAVFTWVFSPNCTEGEKDIFLQLGANGVVDQSGRINELILLVRNFFLRKERTPTNTIWSESHDKLAMKEANLSIIIDGEKEISLTKLEFQAISILFNQVNTAVSYEKLYVSVWGDMYENNRKYRVANLIFHIRGKLGDVEGELIRTIRSKGYMLSI